MLGTQELALFAFTVFVVNATPGVDMAFTRVATLRGGVKAGLAALVAAVALLRRLPPSRWAARLLNGAGSLLFAGLATRLALADKP